MSLQYRAIGWNRQKRIYDTVLAFGVAGYLAIFVGLGAWIHPYSTVETLLIRGFGTVSFLLLHVILCIGPLSRLDKRFLPLIYNRRHLGVTMFVLALAHGVFALIQFHGYGNLNPLLSLLVSNQRYDNLPDFPFQQLGLVALILLLLMAATSHDFWLHNLTPRLWKRLHMGVYLAYGLLVAHVTLGALQSETNTLLTGVVAVGLIVVLGLHLASAWREHQTDKMRHKIAEDGFVEVSSVAEIPDNRAKVVSLRGERVAIFRYRDEIFALSNVCAHQNGPLGEGKIIDGCVTCPWHGYQYLPETGASPPPFHEKVATFPSKVINGKVFVSPESSGRNSRDKGPCAGLERASRVQDEFYVGYEPKAPPQLAKHIKRIIIGLNLVVFSIAFIVVFCQRRFEPSFFEYGTFSSLQGIVKEFPIPSLLIRRPGADDSSEENSRFVLVAAGKHGVETQLAGYEESLIRLQGTLIYRDGLTMLELVPRSITQLDGPTREVAEPPSIHVGDFTLKGEIVDSKCYLGAMNPGEGKVHRDCAVRCISGGIPPAFLIRSNQGKATVLFLLGTDGRKLNAEILDHVAEPLEIHGQVIRSGEILILKSEPATFEEISTRKEINGHP